MKLIKSVVIVGIVILAVISSGCVSYQPPPPAVNADNYTTLNEEQHHSLPNTGKELTVSESIRVSLANNPDFKTAHYAMVAAWATFYTKLAVYSPQLTATFAGTQNQMQSTGTSVPWEPQWQGEVQAKWLIFDGLIREMNMLSARASVMQSEELERDYRRLLIKNVVIAYNAILLTKAQTNIDQANEIFEDQMVKTTNLKYQAGAANLPDLLNYKILKNKAQETVLLDIARYKAAKYALAVLMGLTTVDFPENTKFPEVKLIDTSHLALGVDYYLDMAVAQRPDLKAQRHAVGALKYNVYSAWGAFSPTLNANLNYGYERDSFASGNKLYGSAVPRGQDLNYNYGFTADWLLWDGGDRIATVRQNQALLAQGQESLLATWMNLIQDVRTSYTNLMTAIAAERVLGDTEQLSKKQRDLVAEQYLAGNVDVTRMNQAQTDYVTAATNHLRAIVTVMDNDTKLKAACNLNDIHASYN